MDDAEAVLLKHWNETDHAKDTVAAAVEREKLFARNPYGGKKPGSLSDHDLARVFRISYAASKSLGRDGSLPRHRMKDSGRWYFEPQRVAEAILNGFIPLDFLDNEATEDEVFQWACDAFCKTLLRVDECPDGKALRLWLHAVKTKAGEERLMKWMFGKKYKKKVEVDDGNSGDSGGPVDSNGLAVLVPDVSPGDDVAGMGEPGAPEADEDAARIEEEITRAKASGKIDAPYCGQDPEKNRKRREAPIYIPNLDEV